MGDWNTKSGGDLISASMSGDMGTSTAAQVEMARRDGMSTPPPTGGTGGARFVQSSYNGPILDFFVMAIPLGVLLLILLGFLREAEKGPLSRFEFCLAIGAALFSVLFFIGLIKATIRAFRERPVVFSLLIVGSVWLYWQLPPMPHLGQTAATTKAATPVAHKRHK